MTGRFSALIITLVLASCGDSHFYSEQKKIDESAWFYQDTLQYQVEINDTTSRYDIGLEIEHSTDYQNQNLYIKIITTFPDGESVAQTLPIDLADHTGVWYGNCKSSHCSVVVTLQNIARFDRMGNHLFEVVQYMRENPVQNIESVTFYLDRVGS